MEIVTGSSSEILKIQLTLHQIFFFWYAIMLGTMLATVGSRPKRNIYLTDKSLSKSQLLRQDENTIKNINTLLDLKSEDAPDSLIEGILGFETADFWVGLHRCFRHQFSSSDYKIPKGAKYPPRYPAQPATRRLLFSIFILNIIPILIAWGILSVIPKGVIWTGDLWVFLFVGLPAFVPFYLYRIYVGLLYHWGKYFYGSEWQAYFQLGLISRPIAHSRPLNHLLPGFFLLLISIVPTYIFFNKQVFFTVFIPQTILNSSAPTLLLYEILGLCILYGFLLVYNRVRYPDKPELWSS